MTTATATLVAAPDGATRGGYHGTNAGPHLTLAEDRARTSGRLHAITLPEFLRKSIPPRDQILAPWLLSQSLSMIYAWRGVGKTFVALNIAHAVATGGAFLSWKADRARKVLYIDGEMPASELQGRLRGIVTAAEREVDPSFLRIVTPDLQDGPMPDLATAKGQAEVDVITEDADLIIVDNISTLVRSTSRENDAESWNEVGAWALRMRQQGRCVLFIHHSGKGGSQRGSSKKEDTLDTVICLKQPADYSQDQGARFQIFFEKARNGGGDDLKPFEAALTRDKNGHPRWTFRPIEDSNFDRVIALANTGLSQKEIARELKLNKSTVSRYCCKGEAARLITKVG